MKQTLAIIITVLTLAACEKTSETIQPTAISEYAPLTVGKFITYTLDSLVFINAGTTEAHRLYEVKYQVADTFKDNVGRKVFRIIRSIRTLPNGTFISDNTFIAKNLGTTYEFSENNLNFIKLVQPIKDAGTWKGNTQIDASSINSNLQYLFDWNYTYANVGKAAPLNINGLSLPNTITVNQQINSFNLPVVFPGSGSAPTNIASKDSAVEIYAKNIGMVYKKFLHWEYQISPNGASGAYTGYGITLKIKEYN